MVAKKIAIGFPGYQPLLPLNPLAAMLLAPPGSEPLEFDDAQRQLLESSIAANFTLADPKQADVLVHPHYVARRADAAPTDDLARRLSKPGLLMHASDDLSPFGDTWSTVFRCSAYRSRLGPNERVMPALCSDPMPEADSSWQAAIDPDRPAIGFCGFVGTRWSRLAYTITGRSEKVRGLAMRNELLGILGQSDIVQLDAIVRDRFRAGMRGGISKVRSETPRREYLHNMLRSPFTLCVRGAGNFSFRFYESLACGRVPCVITRDEALPFEDAIPWHKHVLRVDWSEARTLPQRLQEFSKRHGAEGLRAMGEANRALWLDKLCAAGFFTTAIRQLAGGLAR